MESWRQQAVVFWAFLLPGALWLLVFFLVPLGLVWMLSFGERPGPVEVLITGTRSNYVEALDPLYQDRAEPCSEGAWAHAGDEPPLEELLGDSMSIW
jgi:ABC-type sugar transport system permease subunit